jgi:hypothetical protein
MGTFLPLMRICFDSVGSPELYERARYLRFSNKDVVSIVQEI